MLELIGRKLGITQKFTDDGNIISVTVVRCGPCTVIQKKTREKEGYNALQLGFEETGKVKRETRAVRGHFQKAGTSVFKHLAEMRTDEVDVVDVGDQIGVGVFRIGDRVSVRGKTKGRGFQGVVKRHGKKGGGAAHGSHFHRAPGSIGMNTWPARVIKNMKLPGHMGSEFVTVKNLEVVDVEPEKNLLYIKGSVPGAVQGLLKIKNSSVNLRSRIDKKGS